MALVSAFMSGTSTIEVSSMTTRSHLSGFSALNATATAGADYTAASGTLSFAQGELSKTFTVQTATDALFEGTETFTATLSNATGGTISRTSGSATGTIVDANTAPVFSVSGGQATEGGAVTFTGTPPGDAQAAETVSYATADGTATAGSDYTAASGTLSFAQGELSKTFTVQTATDALFEGTETFTATLSNATGGTISPTSGSATGTIVDANTAPVFSVSGGQATEGGAVTFTVTRSGDAQAAETVSYATADGTATAGSDYTAASGTLSFAQGELSKTFTVQTATDALFEGTETFTATLSNATGGTISPTSGSATGTIVDA